jgi:ribosomal protein S18 acetylase RimI-like enzyme
MQEPMTFSTAEPRRSSMLVSLVNRAYSPQPEAAGWVGDRAFQPGDRTDEAEVSGMLADPATVVLIGSRGGVVTSCVALTRRADSAYLGLFAVDPDRQGGGAGRQTMAAAESHVRERWGIDRVDIHVMEHHGALMAWYQRLGYTSTGERKPFTDGSGAVVATLVGMRKVFGSV